MKRTERTEPRMLTKEDIVHAIHRASAEARRHGGNEQLLNQGINLLITELLHEFRMKERQEALVTEG